MILFTSLYLFVSSLIVLGLVWSWVNLPKKLWNERWPEEFKLRRGPGETLMRELIQMNDQLPRQFLLVLLLPGILGLIPIVGMHWVPKQYQGLMLICAGLMVVVSMGVRVKRLFAFLERGSNTRLGYFGERATAEHLEPLAGQGYQVFHDVPAENRGRKFNLDHVTVGPTGIKVIETKAYRKRRGRPGYEEHKVSSDGQQLSFPWGETSDPLRQTRDNVTWLRQWLKDRTGEEFPVHGVLALPGWYVTEKKLGDIRVVNAKSLPSVVTSTQWANASLDPRQVTLVARQLKDLCTDVEAG